MGSFLTGATGDCHGHAEEGGTVFPSRSATFDDLKVGFASGSVGMIFGCALLQEFKPFSLATCGLYVLVMLASHRSESISFVSAGRGWGGSFGHIRFVFVNGVWAAATLQV